MKYSILFLVLIQLSCSSILNSKWRVTKAFKPFQENSSIIEKTALNAKIVQQLQGMEIHFLHDSIFMIHNGVFIDKGRIKEHTNNSIEVLMGDGISNIIEYEVGEVKDELIIKLPDGTKLYTQRIK